LQLGFWLTWLKFGYYDCIDLLISLPLINAAPFWVDVWSNPYPWFNDWETALNILSVSYKRGEVAHLDLSPRSTIPMSQVSDQEKFLGMIKNDVEWFFRVLPLCGNAKLLMMAGSVTKKYYLVNLLKELAENYGFKLLFKFEKGGDAPTSFHKLKSGNIDLPIFFCGVSPSARKSKLLIERVGEKRGKLLSYLKS
tara:strand:- start:126 stop:710 length:585 start_codon:yes stop_codon:yes gene_type:complete